MRMSKFIRSCKVLIFNGAYSPKGGGEAEILLFGRKLPTL